MKLALFYLMAFVVGTTVGVLLHSWLATFIVSFTISLFAIDL